MLRVWTTSIRARCHARKAQYAHQSLHPLAVDRVPDPAQVLPNLAAAVKWMSRQDMAGGMMKRRITSAPTLWIVILLGCWPVHSLAQDLTVCPGISVLERITVIRAESRGLAPGRLFVVVGKTECKVSDDALKAWILRGGKQVIFSTPGGVGGFENEGQSLHLYDLVSDTQRVVLSEYFSIGAVLDLLTQTGQRAVIVEMHDGGLGASHIAIVDRHRGEVFVEQKAKVMSRTGHIVVLGYFHDEEWEALAHGINLRSYRTKSYSLSGIMKGKPILREPVPQLPD